MSSKLLDDALGVRHYRVTQTVRKDKIIAVYLEQDPQHDCCSACRSDHVIRRGLVPRTDRTVPIGGKPVELRISVLRLGCRDCQLVREADITITKSHRRFTLPFEQEAIPLLSHMTIPAVAEHLQVGWDALKDLFKRHLQTRFGKPKLKHLKHIAIDEISIGHGHRYLTVVLDLIGGAVVFIGKGQDADALKPFWNRLKKAHAKIQAVSTDMSPAYLLAVFEYLPKAIPVFAHFHVVRLFNDRLSGFRRELQREIEGPLGKKVLKGTRGLILQNPENLREEKGKDLYQNSTERERLDEALRLNQPLATAYYMKEEFRQFWKQESLAVATLFLDDWCRRAEASKVSVLMKMASTFVMHRKGLLHDHRCRISTGPLEGLNNKIKTLQRQAYGYRDREFFELRIDAIHLAKYALVE